MPHQLRLFAVAVQYFTRLPVPAFRRFDPGWLGESARYFPLVGLLVGALAALVWWLGMQVFPAAVAAGLSLLVAILLTGAFHEDGLADTFDALGGQVDRDRALAIMKDSRLGSYGSIALILVLGLRWSALMALPAALGVAVLLALHPAARAGAGALMHALPYVRDDDSRAKPVAQGLSSINLAWVLAFGALPALLLALLKPHWWLPLVAGLLAVGAVHLVCRRWFRRRLGGYTGDTLGCTEQLGELAFLLAALAAWKVA